MQVTTKSNYILNTKSCWPYGFKRSLKCFFSHYKSMGAIDIWGVASLDTKIYGRIYVGDH